MSDAGGMSDAGQGGAPSPCVFPPIQVTCLATDPSAAGGASASTEFADSELAVAELRNVRQLDAINRHNQVAGIRDCGGNSGGLRAFLYDDGVVHDLPENMTEFNSGVVDINDHGVVLGYLSDVAELGFSRFIAAFIWNDGVTTLIDDPRVGGPVAINNRDQVILRAPREASASASGFLWEDGVLTELGPSTRPTAINDSGQITGSMGDLSAPIAFIWDDGDLTQIPGLQNGLVIDHLGHVIGTMDGIASGFAKWDGVTLVELPARGSAEPSMSGPSGTFSSGEHVYSDGLWTHLAAIINRWRNAMYYDTRIEDLHLERAVGSVTYLGRREGCIGGGQSEKCEEILDAHVVWSPGCFGACCGQASGEGGAGGGGPL